MQDRPEPLSPQDLRHLGVDPDRLGRIRAWMAAQGHRLPGLAVQMTRRGQVVFSARHGLRDAEAGLPVTHDTVWRIYSMTKPLTSILALTLYEEGAFRLDQPLADFLPGFADMRVWKGPGHDLDATEPLNRPVTIHDLFTHQAGLPYGNPAGDALERAYIDAGLTLDVHGDTAAQAITRLTALPLADQPGARWRYGVATDVLGHLVEVLTGQSLDLVMADRLLTPLGMTETGFQLRPDQAGRLAALYQVAPGGFLRAAQQAAPFAPVTFHSGGGGLVSTLGDYQRFVDLLLARGRGVLGRKTFDLMVANHMHRNGVACDLAGRGQPHFSETTFEGIGFGLGVSVMLDPARAKILGTAGEFAWGGAASTAFWVDPVEDLSVILMTQLLPSSAHPLRRELRALTYQALI
ncbi:beta-lactamase family protein [Rhodobacter sp. KR11]|uniref:serine hydrolase domain-containing protein n=1 Tax=Rhodobacter sp. KR11 TaxID=2974588 RepID=UPI0022234821|nr:serine hydrolase domain-containing protein [Rhodobacter sp. KR11]MCW1919907.1 beta-lactamase family protein [Rhodobacter sp. KR11]